LPTFRVFGRKYQDYYIKVEAKDGFEAIDIANAAEQHKWSMLPDDDVIEAIDVYMDDQSFKDYEDIKLNKDTQDEWPSMKSGILVEGIE
jgi:hypothetical protein